METNLACAGRRNLCDLDDSGGKGRELTLEELSGVRSEKGRRLDFKENSGRKAVLGLW